MSLSKPKSILYQLLGAYFERLYTNPVKTKAITSCIISTLGNYLSQKICGAKRINEDTLLAFALFGLIFGGPVPHYFYASVQSHVKNPLILLCIERLIYMPCFQAVALYMLSLFEGHSHREACRHMQTMYWPIVMTSLKYLTLLQFINIKYVPPVLRVLVANLIGFCWTIFLAQQRAKVMKGKSTKKA